MGMRKIESQEEQFPDRVAEEKAGQEEQPYLRTTDVNPRIHFMAPEGMDSERAKKFEDAFTRKMVNEVGDPSLPKVPPRGQSPQAPVPTQAAPQGPAVSAPTPEGYDALYPQGPAEWQQFSQAMWPHKSDRFHENYAKSRKRDEQTGGPGWGEHHPWESMPQNWQRYVDLKQQRQG